MIVQYTEQVFLMPGKVVKRRKVVKGCNSYLGHGGGIITGRKVRSRDPAGALKPALPIEFHRWPFHSHMV